MQNCPNSVYVENNEFNGQKVEACPFCDADTGFEIDLAGGGTERYTPNYRVRCGDCNATGSIGQAAWNIGDFNEAIKFAIEVWNKAHKK